MQATNPDFERAARQSFANQPAMVNMGAEVIRVEPGVVEIGLAMAGHITQQHGFVHGGVIAACLDTACGFAAFSLMPAGAGVLTVEFKANFVAPAAGERFRFIGKVRKAGRTITLCEADAFAIREDGTGVAPKLIATMTATMMTLLDRPGVKG